MPKASSATSPSSASTRSSTAAYQNAQVLRRNQACHQCRRRKLKCDAKRPSCSTCVRSHAYAVAHAPPGTEHAPHPECTFDEVSEPSVVDTSEPKNRFERLENRISELEALLQEKDQASPTDKAVGPTRAGSAVSSFDSASLYFGFQSDSFDLNDNSLPVDPLGTMSSPNSSPLDDLAGIAAFLGTPAPSGYTTNGSYNRMDMMTPGWPRHLPNLSTLRHLVEAYFNFTPLAGRMFHAPTFLASLSLPPTHPKFPLPATLHAMCAMGSMYTAAITHMPSDANAVIDGLGDTFAEIQIRAAKNALAASLRATSNIFESLQAQVIIASWYWYNARWSEACVAFAVSLRYAVPCGLNMCPPFESISTSSMSRSSIILPATNVIEDEMRRNTFWIAYMMERHFTSINSFATFLDDEDICQMLPVCAEQFDRGILVPPLDRQWSHDHHVIETQPEEQVDSFVLHVKATMLLSKIKQFNCRYKARKHRGDPDYQPDPNGLPGLPRPGLGLTTTTRAFRELDDLIVTFRESFPPHLRDPMAGGTIDGSLLTALSSTYFATIILHEGHAHVGQPACVSSCKILASSRAILDLLHSAYSTSHNLATLGVFPMVCWFAACRVLIRFLRSALDAKSQEHITALRTEIDFIRTVITDIGESFPHAQQYGKMLTDYLSQTCGKEFVQARSMPAIIPSPSQQSQSSDELSMVPDSPQLNLNLDPHHPAMVEA
ncbi:hypothetical protein OH76DRAFT_1402463 [Lentinus brumalis]|uniref:Zn(2)-C6 fungal-type domain-containing protein n=1 Tax=Lentinus brumalis TaxID=2498619 RepID=A0A371DCZ5_9APHY|nr:hypothetical protein OH76DRAFT_1402463 [Polyporus brumalis]